jgi:hypothetical protein
MPPFQGLVRQQTDSLSKTQVIKCSLLFGIGSVFTNLGTLPRNRKRFFWPGHATAKPQAVFLLSKSSFARITPVYLL